MEEVPGPTVECSIGADTVERTIVDSDCGGMLNTSVSLDDAEAEAVAEADAGMPGVSVDVGASVTEMVEDPELGVDVMGGVAPEIVSEGRGNPPALQVSS